MGRSPPVDKEEKPPGGGKDGIATSHLVAVMTDYLGNTNQNMCIQIRIKTFRVVTLGYDTLIPRILPLLNF